MITYDGLRVLMMAEDDSRCCFGLFGPPSQPKNVRIRPQGYFFKLRSILMLPGLEILIKSEKVTKELFYRKPGFPKMIESGFELMSLYIFSRRIRISSPNRSKINPGADFDKFSQNHFFRTFRKSPGGGIGRRPLK